MENSITNALSHVILVTKRLLISLNLSVIFILSGGAVVSAQYSVTGNTSVCPLAIEFYTVAGSPTPVTYTWSCSGGNIVSYAGASVTIVWGSTGAGNVSVDLYDANGILIDSPSLTIIIDPAPAPVLTTDFSSDCVIYEDREGEVAPVIVPDDCWHFCENSTVHYYVNPINAGSTLSWTVSGSYGFSSSGTNEIEVYWGGPGNGSVSVTETNQFGCTTTVTKCVKIIESPRAIITGFPGGADCREGGIINVCIDQEALFFGSAYLGNSNSPIVSWLWNFDDPTSPTNFSTHQNETHIWANPGTYFISLTVTNACNCSATCTLEVMVEPVNGVNIECATPVCANGKDSYYTDAVGCVPYNWTVINGIILSPLPYTSSIQVQWNDGSNGNGILCLDNSTSSCPQYCASITCIEVPIISTTTSISGPSVVCIGSQTKYTVPSMTGSIYTWTITGVGGTIVMGQGTNEIFVDWPLQGTANIHVTYTNDFLDCGGSGDLLVEMKEQLSISGPEKGCPGGNVDFVVLNPPNNTVVLNWTATDELGQINSLGSNTGNPLYTVNWTYGSGTFVITATDNTNTYCNQNASFVIEISNPPPTPDCPVGDLNVCPGTPHIYSAIPTSGNYYLNWNIVEGTPANANGNFVSITWDAILTGYQILLTQIESGTGCESLPCTLDVAPIVPVAPALDSYSNACINSTATYTINTDQSNADQIMWSIANTSMGSVVSGQNTTTASIQWNNTTGATSITIQIVTCGILGPIYTFPITLLGNSQLTVIPAASTICDGASVDFSVSGNPPGSYSWDFGDASAASTATDPPPHPYTNTTPGTASIYAVTVTVIENGCTSVGTASVNVLPTPGATIQASPAIICLPNTTSTLTAIQQGANLTYTWLPGSFSTQSIIVTAGTYTLTVQNTTTGCSSFNSFTVQNCPSGGVGCPSSGNPPDFSWSPSPVICGNQSVAFTQTVFPPNQASVLWDFGDGNTSTAASPIHQYTSAGNYSVVLVSYDNSGNCDIMFHNVLVPLFAQFTATFFCDQSATGNYETHFINQSTYTDPLASIIFAWYANGSGTPFSFNENPIITSYSGTNLTVGGNNTILLVISNGTAVCSTTVNNFYILAPPSPLFTIAPISPGPYCQGQTNITFTGNSPGVHHALWNFGDGSSSTIFPVTDRVYSADGSHTIILTVEDDYGCDYNFQQNIIINPFGLIGNAAAIPDHICPGGFSELNINPMVISISGSSIISQLWSNGSILNPTYVNQTGTYNVIVTDDYGCSYEPVTPVNITAYNVPSPVIRGDLTLCEGENIMLDGFEGLGNPTYQYLWTSILSNSATEAWLFEFDGATAGTYNVQLQIVAEACTLATSVDVVVNPLPPIPNIQSSVTNPCEGQPIDLTVINAGTNWVNWSNGASGPMITVFNANIYEATLTDANGCTNTGQIEVHENPYFGFLFTGCVDFCDTVEIIIPGSGPLIYDKWEWWVDGQQFNSGANSVVPDLNLGMLPAGIYHVSLYLVYHFPDGTDCGMWSDPLEITVKTCPCHMEPQGRMYCMEVVKDDDNQLHNYHFEIWTHYDCPGTPNVTVTSPDGGVTLLPASNPPNYLTGIISTYSTYPQSVCFDLDFVDPLYPECNCSYRYCMRLPKCPFEPPCDFQMWMTDLACIGYDGSGHPVYTFNLNTFTAGQLYSNFFANNGWLSGMPATIGPGLTTISGTFTDATPADGFCIYLYAYDFTTHQMCEHKVCVSDLPNCNSRFLGGDLPNQPILKTSQIHVEPELNLLPNPATNVVNIRYSMNERSEIRIEDTQGRIIFEMQDVLAKGTIEINTDTWVPGIYFASISNNRGEYMVSKLVIIK